MVGWCSMGTFNDPWNCLEVPQIQVVDLDINLLPKSQQLLLFAILPAWAIFFSRSTCGWEPRLYYYFILFLSAVFEGALVEISDSLENWLQTWTGLLADLQFGLHTYT